MNTLIKTSIRQQPLWSESAFHRLCPWLLCAHAKSASGRTFFPDGGYPGGNTAEGQAALLSLTGGTFNTAVGFLSLRSNTEGQFNTATGAGTLLANQGNPTAGEGIENTATGAGALLSNTTGAFNSAHGAFALFSNTEGLVNVEPVSERCTII